MCPLPHPGGGWGWLARSFELGEERCCYRRPPSFPGLPEIPAARCSPPFFSLLAELLFRACGSPRSCSVSFCPLLRLSALGSFLFMGPHRVGSDFPSLSHFFTVHPFDSAVWSLAPPLPEVRGGRTIPDSLPPRRPPWQSPGRREEPCLAPLIFPGSGLSDCPGLARCCWPWEKCSRDCRFPRRSTGISVLRLFTLEPFRVGLNFN